MDDKEYLKSIYNGIGGSKETGGSFDDFYNAVISDDSYRKTIYDAIGGVKGTGGSFDEFTGYVKKKEDSLQEQGSTQVDSGNGLKTSQDEAAVKEMLTPVDEIAFTGIPKQTQPTPQQVSEEQFKQVSGIEPADKGLPKGYEIGSEEIPKEIINPPVDPVTGIIGKSDKKTREYFRNQIKESFLTPEEKEDATLFEMMTKSGVSEKNLTPQWDQILRSRDIEIDKQIAQNELKKKNFGVGSPEWNSINERIKQLQSRKDYFITPPELKIDQAIVRLGGTIDDNPDRNRYEQLTRKVEEKFAELQEVNKLIKENYSKYPFSESLIGGLHGMGAIEDLNRKRREELTKELKDVAPVIFTGLNPNLDKDTFTDTFLNAITPDVLKESTNQEKAINIDKVLNDIGVNLSPEDANKIKSVAKEYELNDPAYAGELIGNTAKIGAKIYAGSALASGVGAGLGLNTLLNGTEALNMYKSSQYVKNLVKGSSAYGVAGSMFGDEDDLNIFSGAMMGLGGTAATALISKIPSQVKDNFLKEFTSKISKAVATGAGEVGTESLEQAGSYINQAVKDGSFDKIGEYIDRDFGSYSDVVKFIASSFAMGLPGSIAIDDYRNLSDEDKSDLNNFLKNASEYQDKSDLVNFNSEDLEHIINDFKERKNLGQITEEKFKELASSSQLLASINEQIDPDLDLKDKVKAQSLLIDKAILEDKIKGLSPKLGSVIETQNKIKKIDEELQIIGTKPEPAAEDLGKEPQVEPKPQTDAVQEQSPTEVPIRNQPEGSQEIRQGNISQPVQEVTSEGKKEEVTPVTEMTGEPVTPSEKIAFTEQQPTQTTNEKEEERQKNVLEETPPKKTIEEATSIGDLDGYDYNDDTFLDKAIKKLDEWDNDLDTFQKNNLGVNIAPTLIRAFIKTLKVSLKATRSLQKALEEAYKSVESNPEYINLSDSEKQTVHSFLETVKQSKIKVKKSDIKKATEGKMPTTERKKLADYFKSKNIGAEQFKESILSINDYAYNFLKNNNINPSNTNVKRLISKISSTDIDSKEGLDQVDSILNEMLESENVKKFKENKKIAKKAISNAVITNNQNFKLKDMVRRLTSMSYNNQSPEFINLYNDTIDLIKDPKRIDSGKLAENFDELSDLYIEQESPGLSKAKSVEDVTTFFNSIVDKIKSINTDSISTYEDLKKTLRQSGAKGIESIMSDVNALKEKLHLQLNNNEITPEQFDSINESIDKEVESLNAKVEKIPYILDEFEKKRYLEAKSTLNNIDKSLYTKAELEYIDKLKRISPDVIGKLNALEAENFYLAAKSIENGVMNKFVYDTIVNTKAKEVSAKVDAIVDKVTNFLKTKGDKATLDFIRQRVSASNFAKIESMYEISKKNDRPIQDLVRPIIAGIVKSELNTTTLKNNLFDVTSKLSSDNKVISQLSKNITSRFNINKTGLHNRKLRNFRLQVGLLLDQLRHESSPVLVNGKLSKIEDLPVEYRDKFKYLYDNEKASTRNEADDYYTDKGYGGLEGIKDAYDGLIKKTVDGKEIIDLEANMKLLESNEDTKAVLDEIKNTLSELSGKAQVNSTMNGIEFIFDPSYFPRQNVAGSKARSNEDFEFNDLTGNINMDYQMAMAKPGSAYKSTRGMHFVNYDYLNVLGNHISDVNDYFHVAPDVKSVVKGINLSKKNIDKTHNKELGNEEIGKRKSIFVDTLIDETKARVAKTFFEGRNKGNWLFNQSEKLLRRMALGNFLYKVPKELPSNVVRMLVNHPEIITEFTKDPKSFHGYDNVMSFTGSPVSLKYTQYSLSTNPADFSGAGKSIDKSMGWSDTPISKMIWIQSFKNKFKEINGNEFNLDEFNKESSYKINNREDIEKASTLADQNVNELMNAQSKFYAPHKIKLMPFVKPFESTQSVTRALSFLQSVNINDTGEFYRRLKDLSYGTNEGRAFASKRIAGMIASNMLFNMISGYIINQSKALLDDDDDEYKGMINAYNETKDKIEEDAIASVVGLMSGNYGWLFKIAGGNLIIPAINEFIINNNISDLKYQKKKGLISKEEYNERLSKKLETKSMLNQTFFELYKTKVLDWSNVKPQDITNTIPMIGKLATDAYSGVEGLTEINKFSGKVNRGEIDQKDLSSESNKVYNDYYNLMILGNTLAMALAPNPVSPIFDDYMAAEKRGNIYQTKKEYSGKSANTKISIDEIKDVFERAKIANESGLMSDKDYRSFVKTVITNQKIFYKKGELDDLKENALGD